MPAFFGLEFWKFDNPELWAAIGLLTFLLIVWKFGGFKKAMGALDAKAEVIQANLDEAARLRPSFGEGLAGRLGLSRRFRLHLLGAGDGAADGRFPFVEDLPDARREHLRHQHVEDGEQDHQIGDLPRPVLELELRQTTRRLVGDGGVVRLTDSRSILLGGPFDRVG